MDFMSYSVYNGDYKSRFLGAKKKSSIIAKVRVWAIRQIRKPAIEALSIEKEVSTGKYCGGGL